MRLITVDLNGDTICRVGEVDPPDEPVPVVDLMLTDRLSKTLGSTQAQHAGLEYRLDETVGRRPFIQQCAQGANTPASTAGDGVESRAKTVQGHESSAQSGVKAPFDGPDTLDGTEIDERAGRCRDWDPVLGCRRPRREVTGPVDSDPVKAVEPGGHHRELDRGTTGVVEAPEPSCTAVGSCRAPASRQACCQHPLLPPLRSPGHPVDAGMDLYPTAGFTTLLNLAERVARGERLIEGYQGELVLGDGCGRRLHGQDSTSDV